MATDFERHGAETIERVRVQNPAAYLKVVASLLPKDVNLNVRPLDELTDEQLLARLAQLTEMAKPLLAKLEGKPTQSIDANITEDGGPVRYYVEVPKKAESTEAWLQSLGRGRALPILPGRAQDSREEHLGKGMTPETTQAAVRAF